MPQSVVLITGCSKGGIGYALCEAFAKKGCKVYATARRVEAMEGLEALGCEKLPLDVLDDESCKPAVEEIVKREGRIDILVNNAGAGGTGPLIEFPVSQAQDVLNANLHGPQRLINLTAPHMIRKRSGLIINIGSIVGDFPTPWSGTYSVSKAALKAYTEVLRLELQGFGIKVMLITPGAVTSQFGKKQKASFNPVQDSFYKNLVPDIEARANMGQVNALPTTVFATKVASRALSSSPPSILALGGRVWQFWIFGFLPRMWALGLIGQRLGVWKVGRKS